MKTKQKDVTGAHEIKGEYLPKLNVSPDFRTMPLGVRSRPAPVRIWPAREITEEELAKLENSEP